MLISRGFIGNPEQAHVIEDLYHDLGADSYAEEIRRPAFGEGHIDIAATAEMAGVGLSVRPLIRFNGDYKNKTDIYHVGPAVHVEEQQSRFQQDLTFGHEVGHHFLEKVCEFRPYDWLEFAEAEDFCEFFGIQLILDRSPDTPHQLVLL